MSRVFQPGHLHLEDDIISQKYEFNVYDIDMETGKHKVIREGHLDQPSSK